MNSADRETAKAALDKLQLAGPNTRVLDVISRHELDLIQGAFVDMVDGPAAERPPEACSCPEHCDYRRGGNCQLPPDHRASCGWKEPDAMAPRTPPLSDIAGEAVDKHARSE